MKENWRLFGRSRSMKKQNVVVYLDNEGWTRVETWSATRRERRGSLKFTTEELRVLRKAIDQYLVS